MTTYFVRPSGGSDSNSGLSYALAFATLGKAATSVAAGDTVIVAPGTYKELLTVSVSGSGGSVIQWTADYLGAVTDGVGGIVRITGAAANEQSASRANCITATGKSYNNFSGFQFDTTTGPLVNLLTNCTNWVIDKCFFGLSAASQQCLFISGSSQANITVQNSFLWTPPSGVGVSATNGSDVAAAGHLIQNCIVVNMHNAAGIQSTRVRGVTVKNCQIYGGNFGIRVPNEGSAGALHITVTNTLLSGCNTAFSGVALGDIVEDYNDLYGHTTDRANTGTGANSLTYPLGLDARWFFQMVFLGAGPNSGVQVASPFDLASYSALINATTSSPTSTDLRGTSAIGGTREMGALEYDSTLAIRGGAAGVRGMRSGGRL